MTTGHGKMIQQPPLRTHPAGPEGNAAPEDKQSMPARRPIPAVGHNLWATAPA